MSDTAKYIQFIEILKIMNKRNIKVSVILELGGKIIYFARDN